MACAYHDQGVQCGERSDLVGGLQLCSEHRALLFTRRQENTNAEFAEYFEGRPEAPHSPGWTYVVQPPSARWKIGYTSSDVDHRFKSLHRSYGQLVPIAVAPGGRTREALLQHKYRDLRVKHESGEQFEPDNVMRAELSALGVDPGAVDAVARYHSYRPRLS